MSNKEIKSKYEIWPVKNGFILRPAESMQILHHSGYDIYICISRC